jgi:hypothetical protein
MKLEETSATEQPEPTSDVGEAGSVVSSLRHTRSMSTGHPLPLIGEPGWLNHLAELSPRIGVLTFEPSLRIDEGGKVHISEDFGAPRYHPVMLSEFALNVALLQIKDAAVAALLGMLKLLSFAGLRERIHGVTVEDGKKVIDPVHVRNDQDHNRNHVTLVPTRCIAPPDFTLDRLVDAMNPDRPTMEQLMRHAALNGWPVEAQQQFDVMCDRPEWTREQAEAGLAQLTQLGLVVMPERDVPVMHPAHFGQMPAGMVSSVAMTMDAHDTRSDLVIDDGTIDGIRIANALEPGTTQGSKRKKSRSMSKNQRLRRANAEKEQRIAALEADNATKDARIAELERALQFEHGEQGSEARDARHCVREPGTQERMRG